MKLTIEIPDKSVMVTVNAVYVVGDDLRLTSACNPEPKNGEKMTLDGMDSLMQ